MDKKQLVKKAFKHRKKAYAPYSGFKVGAAVECVSEKVYGACNVENSSYGLSMCAERNAIMKALSAGQRKIKRIAVASSCRDLSFPCGACLQVMREFAVEDFEIICAGEKDFTAYKIRDALPLCVESPLKKMLLENKKDIT